MIDDKITQSWVDHWENSIEERISDWKNQFEESIQVKLDFSPESLLIVEEIILEQFANPKEVKQPENFFFIDAAGTYVGEVFRRNDKIRKLKWVVPDKVETFTFPRMMCHGLTNSWVDPFGYFLPATHHRNGTQLYDYYMKNNRFIAKEYGETETSAIHRLEDKGFSYQHFLLIKNDSFSLSEIESTVKELYAKMKRVVEVSYADQSHLLLDMGNNYHFHFQINKSAFVAQESLEIAESYKGDKDKKMIAGCKYRVEFWGDEDADADYINDYMFILNALNKNENLLIFNFRNGIFFDEA